jgi:creatinine amidohydrolase/Fe(II)-dependent formamide hydrolase-like protein
VLKLRFDRERSPLSGVPVALRRPLLRILLEHAEGALRREGRVWREYDPLADREIDRPYPGDRRSGAAAASSADASGRHAANDYVLGELSWPEARSRLQETDLALLPVGAVEQHGPHLPLDIDAWDADYLARRVAAACSRPRPLVLPLIPYGVSYHHEDFAGTLSVTPETLSRMVYEIGVAAARQGITKLIIINGHGGNIPTLQFAAQAINRDAHIFTCVDTGDTSDTDVAKLVDTPNDVHAGEIETSTALATRPDLVRLDQARRSVPRFSSQYLEFSSARSVEWYARTAKISPSGVLGDPTRASREKGEQIWKIMIDHLVAFVESLKGLSLDEIYERRY